MRFECFSQLLSHWASRTPDAEALFYESAPGRMARCSFAALKAAVDARAVELRATGAKCLGVLCDGSYDCVVTVFGAAAVGMRIVLLSAAAPERLLQQQLEQTDADLFWRRDAAFSAVSGTVGQGGAGELLFFTSGTTSRPKAVVLTERSLCAAALGGAELLPLRPEDRLLCALPLEHVFGFVCGLLWGLVCGASVALGRGPRHYKDDCLFFRPTAMAAAPALLRYLLKNRCMGDTLRTLVVGAGDCPWPLLKAAAARGIRVSFGYGLTEISSGVALSLGEDPYAMTVCPGHSVRIAEDGEIVVSAPDCMFRGYYLRPEDTDAVLRDGEFHTGDLGSLDAEGLLRVTGRKKELLVLPDGSKLFLPEYEKDIARVLETNELAVVLRDGAPALLLGEADGAALQSALDVIAPIMQKLPPSQRIREALSYGGPLPRTATGKLRRWELNGQEEE